MFLNAPGSIAFSQEHLKTMVYAKFGGQTECIMGNWKIENWGSVEDLITSAIPCSEGVQVRKPSGESD